MQMKTRVISAAVLIAVTLLCVFASPVTRVLYFALAGGLCAYEYSKNVEKLEARCTLWVMFLYLAGQAGLTLSRTGLFWYAVWLVFCLYTALFSGVLHVRVSGKGALFTLAGLTYPCVLFGILMIISVSEIWAETLGLAALATWSCDAFALFGGSRFGKHKLAPHVSPNKTVEGALCGAAASVAAGALCWFLSRYLHPIPLGLCLVTALVASTMGQIGDLAESLMKRMIGVKDFSNLIPGHGGMFDRADSLLFSIPTTYFCLVIAGFSV